MRIIPTPMSVPWGNGFLSDGFQFLLCARPAHPPPKDLVNWKVVSYALKELVPTDFYATVQHGRGV